MATMLCRVWIVSRIPSSRVRSEKLTVVTIKETFPGSDVPPASGVDIT